MSKKGFTLIELVIVLAIMGILLSMSGISFARMGQGVNTTTTADLIYSRLRLIQELSISDGVSRRATFLLDHNQVRFYANHSDSSELRHLRVVLPPGVKLQSGGSPDLYFGTTGHISTTIGGSPQAFGSSVRLRAPGASDVYIIWYHTGRIRLSPTLK